MGRRPERPETGEGRSEGGTLGRGGPRLAAEGRGGGSTAGGHPPGQGAPAGRSTSITPRRLLRRHVAPCRRDPELDAIALAVVDIDPQLW